MHRYIAITASIYSTYIIIKPLIFLVSPFKQRQDISRQTPVHWRIAASLRLTLNDLEHDSTEDDQQKPCSSQKRLHVSWISNLNEVCARQEKTNSRQVWHVHAHPTGETVHGLELWPTSRSGRKNWYKKYWWKHKHKSKLHGDLFNQPCTCKAGCNVPTNPSKPS